jgi:DNA (cytosine-5)-methyltransferase 1
MKYNLISLFSGCGGLDLGFQNAGFNIIFANDNDKTVWETYEKNFDHKIDGRSIVDIKSEELPNVEGIIGGPPCQSWSLAGKMLGIKDNRGQLFYQYIRILKDKQPLFFVAENVPGIVSSTHIKAFHDILKEFEATGYNIGYKLLDARDYGVPQERKRVIIVGYRKDIGIKFEFPEPTHPREKWQTLKEAIGDLPEATPGQLKSHANVNLTIPNHEYMVGSFSTIYMSRNRLKNWNEQSFTIQAGGRHAPLHPNSTKMKKQKENKWVFDSSEPNYRRLSVREAARIQTFPDSFIFYYKNLADGYKMVGNAVPVKLAEAIARKIMSDMKQFYKKTGTYEPAIRQIT